MERGVYPGLAKCGITLPMLCKVILGMLLAVGSAGMGKYRVSYITFFSADLLSRGLAITLCHSESWRKKQEMFESGY